MCLAWSGLDVSGGGATTASRFGLGGWQINRDYVPLVAGTLGPRELGQRVDRLRAIKPPCVEHATNGQKKAVRIAGMKTWTICRHPRLHACMVERDHLTVHPGSPGALHVDETCRGEFGYAIWQAKLHWERRSVFLVPDRITGAIEA